MAGIASEYLFQDQHVSVYWMMGVKMSLSALTLLGLAYYLDGKKIFLVFKSFKDILGIVLFSILGLAGVQFTYSMTVNYSNATRSEEHTSELQSRFDLVCRLLLEKKK